MRNLNDFSRRLRSSCHSEANRRNPIATSSSRMWASNVRIRCDGNLWVVFHAINAASDV